MANNTHFLRNKKFYLALIAAAVLGLAGGFVTLGFIWVLQLVERTLWQTIPARLPWLNPTIYLLIMCSIGGVLVGLCNKYLGDWPKSLETAFTELKKSGQFDYKHIPQSVMASLASLGFGASLGPEAAIISIVGGFGSWISKRIHTTAQNARFIDYIGSSAALGALFSSPLGMATLSYREGYNDRRWKFVWVTLPGIAAGLAGWWVFRHFAHGGYLDYNFLPYSFQSADLIYFLIPTILGTALSLVLMACLHSLTKLFDRWRQQPILLGVIGGLALALLALTSRFVLFSGHEGIQQIMNSNAQLSALNLIWAPIAKILAVSALLATGWKGGKFFPIMFIGSAVGLALSHVFVGVAPMIGIACGMSAALSAMLRKPLAAMLFMVFIFPPDLYIFAGLSVIIGFGISKFAGQQIKILSTEQ